MAKEIITLPMYPELTDEQAETVVSAMTAYFAAVPAETK
jgi:dTDP-4-amino-4,6-dideoxygalactose transaminase